MHILIDIGNSTIVVALADQEGNISHTWRFKTRKEETVTFFRYELKQGLRKYGVETADVESVVISSVVPEVNDDVAQAINDLTGLTPHFFSIADAEGLLTIDIESPRSWVRIVWLMPWVLWPVMGHPPSLSTSVPLPPLASLMPSAVS